MNVIKRLLLGLGSGFACLGTSLFGISCSSTFENPKPDIELNRAALFSEGVALDRFAGFATKYEINKDWVFNNKKQLFTSYSFASDITPNNLSIGSIKLIGKERKSLLFEVTFKQNSVFDETGKLNTSDKKINVAIHGFDPNPTSYINPNITKEDLGFASNALLPEVAWIKSDQLVQHYNKIFNCKADSNNIGVHSLIPSGKKLPIDKVNKIVEVEIIVGPGIVYDIHTWDTNKASQNFIIKIKC